MIKKRPEIAFTLIILFCGLLLVFMIPYGAGWDEHHYLNRIWEMSKGYLIPNQYLIGLNGKIPSAFLEISYYSQKTIEPQSLAQWQNQFSVHIAKDNVLSGSTGAGYFPTFYILQAFIMGICNRVFNIPIIITIYLIKISYLICYCLFVYFALKILPYGKSILGIVATLPVCLIQASIVSSDSLNLGISFLFISWIIYILKKRDIAFNIRELIITLILVALICTLKVNYIVLLFLLFLIPVSKYKTKKIKILFIIGCFVFFLLFFVGWNIVSQKSSLSLNSNAANLPSQLINIIKSPFNFFIATFNSFKSYGVMYYQELIGFSYYWTAPLLIFILFPLLYFISCFSEKSEIVFTIKEKLIFIFTDISFILLIFLIFNIYYPTPTFGPIWGVGGRYFIPLLLLIPLPFLGKGSKAKLLRTIQIFFYSVLLIVSLASIFFNYHVICGNTLFDTGACYLPIYKNTSNSTTENLVVAKDITVKQDFYVECNNFSTFRFWVKDRGSDPSFGLIVTIKDNNSNVVKTLNINSSELSNFSWANVYFPAIKDSSQKVYSVEIKPLSNNSEQNIAIGFINSNEYPFSEIRINGKGITGEGGDLFFQYSCQGKLDSMLNRINPK